MAQRIVIALGGNALGNSPQEQLKNIDDAVESLVGLIKQGYEIIISHGNGPQVGAINLAFSYGHEKDNKIPELPLAECTAMSQGYIGYHLQNRILCELRKENMPWHVATMVTQIVVDQGDPAFGNPTKPIGPMYSEEESIKLMTENPDTIYQNDSGRGYRKMVPSPIPIDIVEKDSILNLLDNEFVVISCGGGGIPVVKDGDGDYHGVDAVIDKDLASALLAQLIDAEYLFILTAVDHVCINFGKPDQMELTKMTVDEAVEYINQGQFAPGSMLPKVRAAIDFAAGKKGRKAVIASLKNAPLAINGKSGTEISL